MGENVRKADVSESQWNQKAREMRLYQFCGDSGAQESSQVIWKRKKKETDEVTQEVLEQTRNCGKEQGVSVER